MRLSLTVMVVVVVVAAVVVAAFADIGAKAVPKVA